MGRMLGAFDDPEELDRPDLNKCPDCGCFFADDNCPLCGKPCPEEMRAGNRKAVKKTRKKHGGPQYKVTYLDWYHRWWFILLMTVVSPFGIVGIVLLMTSPRKTIAKVIALVLIIVYLLSSTFGITGIVQGIRNLLNEPVDRSLPESEYIAACEAVDAEAYFRSPTQYEDRFVAVSLTVTGRVTDYEADAKNAEYPTYYVCTDADGRFTVLVRDCRKDASPTLIGGDMITVYGEGAGTVTFLDTYLNEYAGPVINGAFVAIIG